MQALADRLQEEKVSLTAQIEELRLHVGSSELSELHPDSINSIDLVPTNARQRITRLEVSTS